MKSRLKALPEEEMRGVIDGLKIRLQRVEADSRLIQPGDLFLAYPGEVADGRGYIAAAVEKGAAAVLWDTSDGFVWSSSTDMLVPNAGMPRLREWAGLIAAQLYGYPSCAMKVIGVTGTNGKTSIAHWLAQALTYLGHKTALVGTIGNGFYGALTPATHTTPEPVSLQQRLFEYQQAGAEYVTMEASSHGLDQARVNGVAFSTAIFTNLTRDHLDYHQNMENYRYAKRQLFFWEGLQWAIINLDDPFGVELAREVDGAQVITYGFSQGAIYPVLLNETLQGIDMTVRTPWGEAKIKSQLIGHFNVANLLACLAALVVNGIPLDQAAQAMSTVAPACGRMQTIGGGEKPLVIVDYAHTPDALEKALSTVTKLRPAHSQLYCVFGCGGDRDRGKRPLMGAAVERFADCSVVTSDNPRTEDPKAIVADILEGMHAPSHVEVNRERAIHWAIEQAKAGDVVLIAGKGHEEYQDIAGVKHPFSDFQVAECALKNRSANV